MIRTLRTRFTPIKARSPEITNFAFPEMAASMNLLSSGSVATLIRAFGLMVMTNGNSS